MYSSQTFPLSSIKTALGKVTHDCRVAKSNGLVSVLISLDFSAAYGSVGHSLLLKTLHLASRKAHTAGFPLTQWLFPVSLLCCFFLISPTF